MTGVQHRSDDRANTVCRRVEWITDIGGKQRQPACLRRLDHCGLANAEGTPSRHDRLTQWPRRLDVVVCAAGGLDQRVKGAVAAVSDRAPHDVSVGKHGEGRLGHGVGGKSGGECAFEGLRRNDNLHRDSVAKGVRMGQ